MICALARRHITGVRKFGRKRGHPAKRAAGPRPMLRATEHELSGDSPMTIAMPSTPISSASPAPRGEPGRRARALAAAGRPTVDAPRSAGLYKSAVWAVTLAEALAARNVDPA